MLSKVKELGGQTIIYGLGDALNKGISLILIPLYIKYLEPDQYGVLESLIVTMGLMVTLSNMGLPEAVFRFYFKASLDTERKSVISTIFFLSIVGQIVFPVILFWNSELLSTLLFKSSEYAILLTLSAANIFSSAFKSIPLAIYRAQKRALMYVSVNCVIATVMLLTNVYFVVILKKGVLGIMLGFLCASYAGVMIVLPTLIREIGFVFDRQIVKKVLLFAIPIGLSQLPLTMIFMADRYIHAHVTYLFHLGIYTLAYKLAKLIKDFVVVPFRLAWGPFIFANEKAKDAANIYSKMTTYFTIIAMAIVVTISVFSFELVNLLTKKQEYLNSSETVPVLCYAFLFFGLSYFAGTGIRLSGKSYYLTLIMVVAACVNIPLNYLLIETYGYIGAAYTLIVTFVLTTILSYFISSKLYFIKFELGRIASLIVASVVLVRWSMNLDLEDALSGVLLRLTLIILYLSVEYIIGFSKEERYRIRKRVGDRIARLIKN